MERGHSVLSIQLDANTLGLRRWLIQPLKYLYQDLTSNSREHMKKLSILVLICNPNVREMRTDVFLGPEG